MAIKIEELLKRTFSGRAIEEKVKIVSGQKPRPLFHLKYRNENGVFLDGDLIKEMYDKISWLTACGKTQKMFCWPCLLMMPPNEWNLGLVDMQYVIDKSKQHEQEPEHLEAVLKLHVFIKENCKNASEMLNPQSGELSFPFINDDSIILRLLIESICHTIEVTNSNSNKFTCNRLEVCEAVNFFRILKPNLNYANSLIGVINKSPEIISRLVDAIIVTLKVAIENQIKESNFVSIILSEHVLKKKKSQISTILRYVKKGQIFERFVGFINLVGSRLQHKDVADHILKVQKEYHCRDKTLSLSVDGAVLQATELGHLFDLNDFQCKYFVPSSFHEFGRILMQSLYQLEDCGLFFKTLNAIESYFENEDNFSKFENMLECEIPHLKQNKWYTTAPFITFLDMYRKQFLEYFHHEQTCSKYVSGEDRIKMIAFMNFLQNLKTIFLLKTFGKVFLNYFDKNMTFSTSILDLRFDTELMMFKSNVQELKKCGFTKLWTEAVMDKIGENAPESAKVSAMNNPDKKSYTSSFKMILDQIIKEIGFRHKDVLKLRFCNLLLDYNNDGTLVFEERLVSLLAYDFPSHFKKDSLNGEIAIVRRDPSLLLKYKALSDIMGTHENYNLSAIFSQLHKLGGLLLTMPILPPAKDLEYNNEKLKQVENFSYIPRDNGLPSGETSILCIEKNMLKDLQSSDSFYDDVIKKYHLMKKVGLV